MSPSGLSSHSMSAIGSAWSRSVAAMFGGGIGAQRLIVTGVEAAVPASPFESSGSAPTWYVPSKTQLDPVGATHMLWFGEPETVSMAGVPMFQVNDQLLPAPLQLVLIGGH